MYVQYTACMPELARKSLLISKRPCICFRSHGTYRLLKMFLLIFKTNWKLCCLFHLNYDPMLTSYLRCVTLQQNTTVEHFCIKHPTLICNIYLYLYLNVLRNVNIFYLVFQATFFDNVAAQTLHYLDTLMQRDNMTKSQFFKSLYKIISMLPKVCQRSHLKEGPKGVKW